MTAANRYREFRAPAENGQVLCDPPWNTLVNWARGARNHSQDHQTQLFGLTISQISAQARNSVISAAETYTSQYVDSENSISRDGPLIVTGHQPELFHPGVWYKNFSAARLADSSGGRALNLIIDSDLCRTAAIRVPTGDASNPAIKSVAFDKSSIQIPYEERQVMDQQLWSTFGERVTDTIAPLVEDPLIREWWPTIVATGPANELAFSFSQARHRLEREWGSHSWELPQSMLCHTEAYRLFALHLFVHADRFRSVYNSVLDEYRTAHHLRNRAQPVPDLHSADGWTESPFWIWSTTDPVRRPLFVRTNSNECRLTDLRYFVDSLPIDCDADPGPALSKLADWESRGIKFRTRALTTTLFVRLLLADVFIHGIGGAKYDQATDSLCREYFGISLPPYATLSGTLHLPIKRNTQKVASATELQQRIRELTYHPERQTAHMTIDAGEESQIEQLIATKKKWINTKKNPQNAAVRHQEITNANQQLQQWLSERHYFLEQELTHSLRQARVSQILKSREYSYCLYPSEGLKQFLMR